MSTNLPNDRISSGLGNVTCKCCKKTVLIDNCDATSACDGNVFCSNCKAEIEIKSGLPGLLCGECDPCLEFMEDGVFFSLQTRRQETRDRALGI